MTSLLVVGIILGLAFLAAGFLEGEPLPIGVGAGLILLCVFPGPVFTVLMGVAALYFIYYILIGFWL